MLALAALVVLAVSAALAVLTVAAWARLADPENWRFEGRWARRPRLALVLSRVLGPFDPLRSFVFLLVLTGLVLAFAAVPTLALALAEP